MLEVCWCRQHTSSMSATEKNKGEINDMAIEAYPVDRAQLLALFSDSPWPPHVPHVTNRNNVPIVDPFDAWGTDEGDALLGPDEDDPEYHSP